PYAIFHEGVLVRRGAGIHGPDDLVGRKVAAIENSTNMALAQTFSGAEPVPFGAGSDDVYADMLAALLSGQVDAVVDDDVVFVPLG
ncbi:amino acid ABC transporter substrate-binding protein, partial [Mycobacterium sp. ITM-2017-0098]